MSRAFSQLRNGFKFFRPMGASPMECRFSGTNTGGAPVPRAVMRFRPMQVRDTSPDFLFPSPGTPGEGQGGGWFELSMGRFACMPSPHPSPPPAYRGREQRPPNLSRVRLMRMAALPLVLVAALAGCHKKSGTKNAADAGPIVLYTSVDEPYARPLVEQFKRETGIDVTLVTDSEASKSVGLSEKLRAEREHPRADVWWSNECFLTINMADEGVLAAYDSPAAGDIPAKYKDDQHRWAGPVLRVRTLVSRTPPDEGNWVRPTHLRDLLRPDLKGRIAVARPTAGTTGGHVAALYVLWGKDRADQFFSGLRANEVKLLGGNSVVAESVARREMWLGVCDNDDAADALANTGKLDATLPDQGEGEDGTLAMPCTVGLVAGAPHAESAKRLIDFLLSRQVDKKLVEAKFAWCSTREVAGKGKFMEVDYHAVA
ncbi:MAG: transporter substrate-binding protein, partial [Phycisphaerales bacterium]|nr:transporter substrate-binding protein [Phycisphaerales bacterium]